METAFWLTSRAKNQSIAEARQQALSHGSFGNGLFEQHLCIVSLPQSQIQGLGVKISAQTHT
jgi:hypothetical protein